MVAKKEEANITELYLNGISFMNFQGLFHTASGIHNDAFTYWIRR
jgi:hypothetical protein